MDLILAGSVAFDYLMHFPGRIRDSILPDHLDTLSLSFLVDSLARQRGGVAANIAYTLALLGERPRIMATVGEDFSAYRQWLEGLSIDTSLIKEIPGLLTASFFVTTDEVGAQIASFYTGAMACAADLHFSDLPAPPDLVVISPNDPGAMAAYVAECRASGIPYLYDPSQQILRLDGAALAAGIEGCTGLFVNDYEWALIQEKTGWEQPAILDRVDFALVTRGKSGSTLLRGAESMHIPVVPPLVASDPTGVGDAFRGGFLKGYMGGVDLECCCRMGALAATYCVESEGPQGHHYDLSSFIQRFEKEFGPVCDLSALQPAPDPTG